MSKHIAVVKLGWVLVGTLAGTVAGITRLTDAAVVRQWGTSAGLGELALKGPQPKTILDPCGDVEIREHAILMTIKCCDRNWPK